VFADGLKSSSLVWRARARVRTWIPKQRGVVEDMVSGSLAHAESSGALHWMQSLDGYKVTGPFARTGRSRVYAGVREADGLEVLLKAYVRDLTTRGASRAQREIQVLRQIAGEGIPRAVELIQTEHCPVLVLERAPGMSLRHWVEAGTPTIPACIEAGIQLAAVLIRVHAGHIIHGDVTPDNVIVDTESGKLHLVDFGIARPLGSASLRDEMHSIFEAFGGGLHFIAPEQAGRMDRGVDARSDLYSLGATLYFMLAGAPPFQCDEPLALIHAHMARVPEPLELRRGDIPRALARIVLRLLEKEPEDRYASAELLHEDLMYCAEALAAGALADDTILPSARRQGRLAFSQRLYGREDEMEQLRLAFERVRSEGLEIVLLSGPPGVGKSALIQELRRRLTTDVSYVIAGKFDVYRPDLPYAAFQAALESLALQMLAEPDARLTAWQTQLRSVLGTLDGVLVDFVPDFGVILGEVSPVAPLGPKETRARLSLMLERVIQTCASAEHPMVLFIDDLQWADAGSRALLLDLLASDTPTPVLLIVAYRDSEVAPEAAYKLQTLLASVKASSVRKTSLQVTPLTLAAASPMLADALGEDEARVRELAECALRKTGGGPLLLQQFALCMQERGQIRSENGAWTWEVAAIDAVDVPEGAVGLLIAKLEELEPAARELLQLAGCIADQFDPPLLAELSAKPLEALHPLLDVLARNGLLTPSTMGFRFAHDRIREAAQLSLPQATRSALHHRMGLLLLDRTPENMMGARCFEIADHLNRALTELSDAERPRVLGVNVHAARRALAAGAPATALRYQEVGRRLLRDTDWEQSPALAFSLFWDHAEALVQTDAYEPALEALQTLQAHHLTTLQGAQVAGKLLGIRTVAQGRSDELLSDALRALRKYGIRWPLRPSLWRVRWELFRTDWLLRGALDERKFKPFVGNDRSWTAPLLLTIFANGTFVTQSVRITCLLSAYAVRAYLRHGTLHGGPGYGLASYAAFRAMIRLDLEGTERYARAVAEWLERVDHGPVALRARFVLQAHVNAWILPRRSLLDPLQRLFARAREAGEVEFSSVIYGFRVDYAAYTGEPLSSIIEQFEKSRMRHGFGALADFLQRAYRLLLLPDWSHEAMDTEIAALGVQARELRDLRVRPWIQLIHWIHVLLFLGRFDAASRFAESLLRESTVVGTAGPHFADYTFLRGMAAAGGMSDKRRLQRRIVRECARKLRVWANHGPDFEPMLRLLDAELARLQGRHRSALRHYEQAAHGSKLRGFVHHAALACERRAELLTASGDHIEAARATAEARGLYAEWQAGFKEVQLGRDASTTSDASSGLGDTTASH